MSKRKHPVLFWLPRGSSIAMALFLAFLSCDALNDPAPWWIILMGLVVHLIPSLIVVAMLIAAWNKPILGAISFFIAGVFMTVAQIQNSKVDSAPNIILLAGPLFLIGYLFFFEKTFQTPE